MVLEKLETALTEALKDIGISDIQVVFEHPTDLLHGDYSTNIALVVAKRAGKNPKELAEEIGTRFPAMPEIARIEVAPPGFINFHLSRDFFAHAISEIIATGDSWGRNESQKGKKVMVEYTDPNCFKPFHIGHLMSNAIGESISRLVEASGATLHRANYQGDIGLHVAKALYALSREELDPGDIHAIGKAYVIGNAAYEDNPSAKAEIDALNKALYEKSDPRMYALYEEGRETSLIHFEEIYKLLGTKFDDYFFESQTSSIGVSVVTDGLTQGVFEKSDGAIVYRGEKEGLHTRVFLNSLGLPTYEAKELGLAKMKFERFPYDHSVVITANEITEYFKVLLSAMHKLFPDLSKRTQHITHGFLRLTTGKMSSRKGNVITGESLIDDMRVKAREKMKGRDLDKDSDAIADAIAVSAIKYAILKQGTGKDIIFDPETSLSFEGDSGPYLQYAHTRAVSVLKKAEAEGIPARPQASPVPAEATLLERLLYRFPEVVERAQQEYEPHYVTSYLIELGSAFNRWYAEEKIVDTTDPHSSYKVALTDAFRLTMKKGLWLLGVRAPERM